MRAIRSTAALDTMALGAMALVAVALGATAIPAGAQPAETSSAWRCDGERVSRILIARQPPTVIGESAPEWARPLLSVALQHRTTQPETVNSFLLLEEGEVCTESRRAESERLLRAQPWIADASVEAVSDGAGGVDLYVTTVDEIPLLIGGAVRNGRVSGAKYGNSNILGEGAHASVEWREGFEYRDGLAAKFINHRVFDGPNRFAVLLERMPLSVRSALSLERPLLTTHQRTAWHAGVSDGSGYALLSRPSGPPLALGIEHTRLHAGAVIRRGGERFMIFAGPLATHERINPASQGVFITDTGFVADTAMLLANRYSDIRRTRAAGVLGVRLLSFVRVEGFDALTGPQDVARGIQVAGLGGRSFTASGGGNVYGADLYVGAGGARSFVAVKALWEAEHSAGELTESILSGRAAWYFRRTPRATLIASGEFAGAWNSRVPFQIPLGDQHGIRGYRASRITGERRALVRGEHRWVVGQPWGRMAFGAAAFAEVGSVWAGDAPFGRDSGLRPAIGVGLLAAIPVESRRLLRVDLALPLVRRPGESYEFRVSTSAPIRLFWNEPGVVSSIRSIIPPAGLLGLH